MDVSGHGKLVHIQQNLKAPKGQFNSFGKYAYRSCEDILEAVKPLLGVATLTIADEIILIGSRYYVRATVTLTVPDGAPITVTAYAREEDDKKGMDASQITGAASSYARKYALNGLFLIDDTKDADTRDNSKDGSKPPTPVTPPSQKVANPNGSAAPPVTEADYRMDIIAMLLEMHGSAEKAQDELERLTTWVDKKKDPPETVKGFRDVEKMKNLRNLTITRGKISDAYKSWKAAKGEVPF